MEEVNEADLYEMFTADLDKWSFSSAKITIVKMLCKMILTGEPREASFDVEDLSTFSSTLRLVAKHGYQFKVEGSVSIRTPPHFIYEKEKEGFSLSGLIDLRIEYLGEI